MVKLAICWQLAKFEIFDEFLLTKSDAIDVTWFKNWRLNLHQTPSKDQKWEKNELKYRCLHLTLIQWIAIIENFQIWRNKKRNKSLTGCWSALKCILAKFVEGRTTLANWLENSCHFSPAVDVYSIKWLAIAVLLLCQRLKGKVHWQQVKFMIKFTVKR